MNKNVIYDGTLQHHGVLGMKWGVRRYQNKDGSLTSAGKGRYLNDDGSLKPNKKINATNFYLNQSLSNVNKSSEKKYDLSKRQKKYMDENGNLTLEGAKATLPLGYDLGRKDYRKYASKELENYSKSWKQYSKTRSDEAKRLFDQRSKELFKKLDEIDVEKGRQWVLKNVPGNAKTKITKNDNFAYLKDPTSGDVWKVYADKKSIDEYVRKGMVKV